MSDRLSRRKLITTGLAGAAGASGLGIGARLADRYGLIPPDDGGIYGVGETMTYAAQRLLTHRTLAREYSRSDISKIAPVKGEPPENETYQRLSAGGFADWRLKIDGLVARPSFFFSRRTKTVPRREPCLSSGLRRGLVLNCRMGWRPSFLRLEPGWRVPAGEVRCVLWFRHQFRCRRQRAIVGHIDNCSSCL